MTLTSSTRVRAGERGQTMVLFALTLLLLALMVCMTLSFSTKVRERIETQNLADAAAFSDSVATARVYNVISMLNRTQISHMVAQAGTLSLVSWTTIYRAGVSALWWMNAIMLAGTAASCSGWNICACFTLIPLTIDFFRLALEYLRVAMAWNPLDIAAGQQAQQRHTVSMLLWADEFLYWYMTRLHNGTLKNQKMAQSDVVSGASSMIGDLSAPGGADAISMRETDYGGFGACLPFGGTTSGAACVWNPLNLHAVAAGMGSRGWAFVTGRWDEVFYGNPMQTDLQMNVTGRVTLQPMLFLPWFGGSGHWGLFPNWLIFFNLHGLVPTPMGVYGYGEDHYLLTYQGPGCSSPGSIPLIPLLSMVKGGFLGNGLHEWVPDLWTLFFPNPWMDPGAPAKHTLSWLPNPGVWPEFVDYNGNLVDKPTDNFGQPKLMSVIQRDYNKHSAGYDPWNIASRPINFKFDNSGPGQSFDDRGMVLNDPIFKNIDISKQMAVSTGIAYYHRGPGDGHHWKEPPNFLNPYWRATLVAQDTDQQGTPAGATGTYRASWCPTGGCAGGKSDGAVLMQKLGSSGTCFNGSANSASCWEDTYHQLAAQGFTGFQ